MFLGSFEDSISPQIAGLGSSWADTDCLVRLLDVESAVVCFRVNRLPNQETGRLTAKLSFYISLSMSQR